MHAPDDANSRSGDPVRHEHTTLRGALWVERFDERLVHTMMRGVLTEHDGVIVARWLDQVLPTCSNATLFFDLEELESYESPVRKLSQRVLKRHADRWTSLHALVRSRIVAMGVSVANVFLDGRVEMYRDHDAFTRAFDRARKQ